LEFSTLSYLITFCLLGGILSVGFAALFALNVKVTWVPVLVSYAIGAMLGAVFIEILPHAFSIAPNIQSISVTLLLGLFLFFILEKLVIWRHCHGNHCEVHAVHTAENCPEITTEITAEKPIEKSTSRHSVTHNPIKYKAVDARSATLQQPSIQSPHAHTHHDHGRSGMMIMIGDTFHNFIDGILIAAAFMADVKLGMVTALAIIAHEIPQEVGDFLILLHSGYTKKQALIFNLVSSLATVIGGLIAYFALQLVESWIPYILALAGASLLYVAVADLIPSLHKRTEFKATLSQVFLIAFGVGTIWFVHVVIA
jgi:zinc and cadmium transporter